MKNSIASTIKKLRSERHLTQKQLAKETGISLSSIIAYENSQREPNSKSMVSLEKYFDVSGAFLRGETDVRKPLMCEYIDETTNDLFLKQLSTFSTVLSKQIKSNQKMVFDIIVEIQDVLKLVNDEKKHMILNLIYLNIDSINKIVKDNNE